MCSITFFVRKDFSDSGEELAGTAETQSEMGVCALPSPTRFGQRSASQAACLAPGTGKSHSRNWASVAARATSAFFGA